MAQPVAWPAFGPDRGFLRLEGHTNTLPDIVGPVDGSAQLVIITEGNHYPVLLPLALEAFPAWCRRRGTCVAEPGRILIITLPQVMVVQALRRGGIALGNATLPLARGAANFPDIVMSGLQPLRALAASGHVEPQATIFARHRGLGLLHRRAAGPMPGLAGLPDSPFRIVTASASEPGARVQYRRSLDQLVGAAAADRIFSREVVEFAGRLGIQHRDVPYALLNGMADTGIIFSHLAAFYARRFPDALEFAPVPGALPFGEEIALADTAAPRPLAVAFRQFFLEAALTAYPEGGFTAADGFGFGRAVSLATP